MSAAGFPALGFNPAPGDVAAVRREAQRFSAVAQEIGSAVRNLEQVDAGYWKGQAATAFGRHVRTDLLPLLSKLSDAFAQASGSLGTWSRRLEVFQQQARALELRAEQAQAGGLAAVQRQAEDLQAEVNRTAQAIAGELQHAGNMAPSPPGWLDSLFHDVSSGWDDTVNWVKDHADAIKLFSDLMSDVSGVLQILAIITAPFEPLGVIFETAALLTGAIALLSALLAKAAGANESWVTIGMDALAVLPGIGGAAKAMSGGVRVAEVGADAVRYGDVLARAAQVGAEGVESVAAKTVTVFGKQLTIAQAGFKITGFADREASIGEKLYQNLRGGQLAGTRGLRLIGQIGSDVFANSPKVFEFAKTIDQTSWAGRGLDAGVKLVPRLYTVPNGIEKDLKSLGTSFGTAMGG